VEVRILAEEIGSLAVRIGLDSSGFQNGVSDINKQLKVLQSEFKANTAALGANAKGIDGLKVKAESLAKTLELQKQKVAALEGAYQKSVESKGKDARATQDLEIKLNNARAALSKTEMALSQTNKEIDQQTDKWIKLGKSAKDAGDKLSKVGSSTTDIGKKLSIGVTAPIIGIGTAAVNAGMEFEAQMSRVQAISGATGDEFSKMNDQALKLGADTAFSASEAAQGMENLASAGFTASETMQAMPGMLSLAAAGGVDVASASDIAASALRGFGLEAGQSGHVADVLAKAAADTNAGVTDMGSALKYAAPPANALGLSLEEVSAAIGIMSNAGIKGEMAGTTLRGALTRLASPSSEAAKMMAKLGISAFDSHGKMLPLSQVISNLQGGMKGLTDEQKQNAIATIFGQESMSGMLTLIQAGPAELDKLTVGFKNSDGAAAAMASTMQNNTKGSIEQMKGSLETAGIKMEQALAPAIKSIADAVGSLADKFSNLSPAQQKFILVLVGITAAIGPVLVIIGTLISSVGAIVGAFGAASAAIAAAGGIMAVLTGPVGIAIAAIIGLIAIGTALYANWDTIKAIAANVWNGVKTAIENPMNTAKNTVKNVVEAIAGFFKNIKIPEIKIPKIKLPHFELTGNFSLMPPQVPKLSVNWYSTGGIFSSPSVIGVGEAGTEAVVPIDKLDELIAKALQKAGIGNSTKVTAVGGQSENVTNNYDITINNPKPEQASDSIRTTLMKHSYGLV
jgi:TP901 family phage tail tape measure protein